MTRAQAEVAGRWKSLLDRAFGVREEVEDRKTAYVERVEFHLTVNE